MDSSEYKLLNEFNKKLKNTKLHSEAVILCNDYIAKTSDVIECKLMESLIDKNNYKKKMRRNEFNKFISDIQKIEFREDAEDTIKNIYDYTEDQAQINTIERIINKKPLKPNVISLQDIRDNYEKPKLISKNCPHCGMEKLERSDYDYVICGYGSKGFDWHGCGFDWCFTCGKKLCKCWNVNHLYNVKNRYHNGKCCKSHAIKTCAAYPEEYCQCRTKFVQR